MILVEDFDTGGPSSIAVRNKYCGKHHFVVLFLSGGALIVGEGWWGEQNVSFIFLFLVLLKGMRMQGQPNPFPCFHFFRNLQTSQKLWKKFSKSVSRRILRTWTSVTSPKASQKARHILKTTGYIHHTNHSTKSPLLHTQLQIKTTRKRRIQTQNRNSKIHQPNTHDLTTHHNHAIHCHTET